MTMGIEEMKRVPKVGSCGLAEDGSRVVARRARGTITQKKGSGVGVDGSTDSRKHSSTWKGFYRVKSWEQ